MPELPRRFEVDPAGRRREIHDKRADRELREHGAVDHRRGNRGEQHGEPVRLPEEILEKPTALTSAEWRTVVQHPRIGQVILEQAAALKEAVPIILHHHERFAGHGYPYGLRANEIPLGARIVAVADAYDAMVHDRPYKRAMTHDQAIAELRRHAGTQFDPDIVELFCDLYATHAPEPDSSVAAMTSAASGSDHHGGEGLILPGATGTKTPRRRRGDKTPAPLSTEMAADEPANAVADSRTMAADGALDLAPPRAQASLPPTSRPTNVVALPARRDRRSSSAG